ncbi:MAG TPA: MerR family transcriptional regulator [Methylocystis sp.]|jgi:DNA-binding transcriptional MerR regulator
MDVTGKSEQAFRTIGEVAESLDLPPHVLRFWETRFKELEPVKRAGGRRYYRPRDVELVMALRHLLYGQGYTIKGVQRILKEQGARAVVESVRAGRFQPGFAAAPDEEARQEDAQDEALDESAAASRRVEPDLPPPAQEQAFVLEAEALPPLVVRPDTPPPMQLPTVAGPLREASGLDEEDARCLRLALADLAECRRLLLLTSK